MPDRAAREVAVHDTTHHICLAAGAGSGKTTVLIERLIHLLIAGHAELHQIAAITFTEKAAAELKTRLAEALRQRGSDATGRGLWRYDLGRAYIGTIHGFCSQLLRENAVEAGIDLEFAVLDEPGRDALSRRTFEAWTAEMLGAALDGRGLLAPLLEHEDLRHARDMLLDMMASPLQAQALLERAGLGVALAEPSPAGRPVVAPLPGESPPHHAARAALLAAAADLLARWRAALAHHAALDFDGLLGQARDLLRDHGEVRRHYQRQLRYVHVDEFQDVDATQAELIRHLCGLDEPGLDGTPRLFVVGDPQQSIYRFRGADVDQFARMGRALLDHGGLSLRLTRCFRSQRRLVAFFNHAFERILVPDPDLPQEGRIGYAGIDPVRPANDAAPAVEFLLHGTELKAAEARALEADALARRLRQLIDSGEPLVGQRQPDRTEVLRPARAGDIALLLRAMTDVGIYEQALRRYQVPHYTISGSGFFGRQEVLDVLGLLRLLDRPDDPLTLAGVLRSPWVGCSDATLYWIAVTNGWGQLDAAARCEHLDPQEASRLAGFQEWFRPLRERRDQLPVAQILCDLLRRTRYRAALAVQPDGRQSLGNLRKIVDLARQFDAGPAPTVGAFVTHLEERLTHTPREAEAALELESGDTVKLMSVHQAKGLEWPVVALVDLARPFLMPGRECVLWSPSLGVALKLRQANLKTEAGPEHEAMGVALGRLELAEQQRVLYVAATRARDRLILSSSYHPEKLAPAPEDARSWLQWVASAFPVAGADPTYPCDADQAPIRTETPPPLESVASVRGLSYPELRARLGQVASGELPTTPGAPAGDWPGQLDLPGPGRPATRLAVTELELFSSCRRRYQLRHLLRMPEPADGDGWPADEHAGAAPAQDEPDDAEPGATSLSVGQVVHEVLRVLPSEARAGDLPGLVQAAARRGAAEDNRIGPDLERRAIRLLEQWLASATWQEVRSSAERSHEVPFVLHPDSATTLVGRLDLMYRAADGHWHVLDFKTDRIGGSAREHVTAHYELQQRTYGLAAHQLLGSRAGEVVFLFLRTGDAVPWQATPEALDAAREHLRATLAAWGSAVVDGDFPRTSGPERCVRCGYRAGCGR